MRLLIFILTLLLTSCKNQIDESSIEAREHGFRYIKGTNTLVSGEVVRKVDGKVVEAQNFKDGKMIGLFSQYSPKGEVLSHGFGTEIKNYESSINNLDLTNCILTIVQIKEDFAYATLYMDNIKLFSDKQKLLHLAKAIFTDYSNRYKIDTIVIFDNDHEYSISKSATSTPNCIIDTIQKIKIQKINFR